MIAAKNAKVAKADWKTVKLGEVCNRVCSGGTPRSSNSQFYDNGTIPWLNTKEIHSNRIWGTEKKITEEGLRNSSAKWISENAVIVAMYGATAGNVAQTRIPLTTNQACCNLEINSNLAFSDYIFYSLLNSYDRLTLLANGAAQQNLNAQTIKEFEISLPPLPTQRKIAAVLCALDDKIENNRKICANLEAQAQALFKSWFVDFEPFGGKMPKDWKMGKLGEIADLIRDSVKMGERPELPYLPIDKMPMHSFVVSDFSANEEAQSSLILFRKWDVLVGAMRVYFHRVLPAPCDGITRTTCFVLRAIEEVYRVFVLLVVNQVEAIEYAQQTSKGSTMPYAVWDGGLSDFETVLPNKKALFDFSSIVEPLIEKAHQLASESRALAELRDALLPKLMSGELDVDDVEV